MENISLISRLLIFFIVSILLFIIYASTKVKINEKRDLLDWYIRNAILIFFRFSLFFISGHILLVSIYSLDNNVIDSSRYLLSAIIQSNAALIGLFAVSVTYLSTKNDYSKRIAKRCEVKSYKTKKILEAFSPPYKYNEYNGVEKKYIGRLFYINTFFIILIILICLMALPYIPSCSNSIKYPYFGILIFIISLEATALSYFGYISGRIYRLLVPYWSWTSRILLYTFHEQKDNEASRFTEYLEFFTDAKIETFPIGFNIKNEELPSVIRDKAEMGFNAVVIDKSDLSNEIIDKCLIPIYRIYKSSNYSTLYIFVSKAKLNDAKEYAQYLKDNIFKFSNIKQISRWSEIESFDTEKERILLILDKSTYLNVPQEANIVIR